MPAFIYQRGKTPDRREEELRRLQAYDAAESRSERSDVSKERVDIARERLALDQAAKERDMALKVQESANRSLAAEQRSAIAEKQLELQKAAQLLQEQKAAMNIEDSIRATQDKIGFLNATRDLREDQDDFEQRLSDAAAKFPHASKDDFVQKRTEWLATSRKTYKQQQQEMAAAKAAEKKAAELKMQPSMLKAGETTFTTASGGTETIKEGDRTITRPLAAPGSPEEAARARKALEDQHATLEASLNAKSGKSAPTVDEIAAINKVKAKLGYVQLDASGKPVAAVPSAAGAAAAAPDTQLQDAERELKKYGFLTPGGDTTAAITMYQIRNGLKVTGSLNEETTGALGISGGTSTNNSAAPTSAPKPQTVRQNGVTYTLQPDGSYK